MQEHFLNSEQLREAFVSSLSAERFATYRNIAKGNQIIAINLYKCNSDLSLSLWPLLQLWEICLRNKLNDFLCWKYSYLWCYDELQAIRQLKRNDQRRLLKARNRQERAREVKQAPLGAIIADLSPGFWVSLLGKSYEVPFAWRYNLSRIFAYDDALSRELAWSICDNLLKLRNRIAHHEPILNLPLEQRHVDLSRIVAAMCPGTAAYSRSFCTFAPAWSRLSAILTGVVSSSEAVAGHVRQSFL